MVKCDLKRFRGEATNIMLDALPIEIFENESVHEILQYYLDVIREEYMTWRKLKIHAHAIADHSELLLAEITPNLLLGTWMSIDTILDFWIDLALDYEIYEGVINLQKLRQMV